MNPAEWSIRNSTITWVVTFILAAVGMVAFDGLSRLEDPEFTIKVARIYTPYPGASAEEVEREVSDLIERASQELGQLFYVESHSYRDASIVNVTIKDEYNKAKLPQVWDELRRKIGDTQRNLPPGAGPSIVNDDFGDVFGVYIALSGDGYSQKELYETAKFLRRELLTVKDVKKIVFYGVPKEVIYVELKRQRMAALGIAPTDIDRALGSKNVVVSAGYFGVGNQRLAINPTGEYKSEEEFKDLLISPSGKSGTQVALGDIADIYRAYRDPVSTKLRYDGLPAIGIAISTSEGGNVVTMGEGLEQKVRQISNQIPLGMKFNIVSLQSESVTIAINNFLVNLVEAVVIVIAVLLFFMGLRSSLIIGAVLIVTITGTFIFMAMFDINLERISLGALIIALGMLVDNAIVVTDGMRMRIDQGEDPSEAAKAVVGQTATPLLGATAVAIAAFAAIGTSQDATGEYTRSLFSVILISLSMSWFTAVTITPLMCKVFLKPSANAGSDKDPYAGGFYKTYRRFLELAIDNRVLSLALTLVLFGSAIIGFGYVKHSFFPDSTRPQFYVDAWFPDGTVIDETEAQLKHVEEQLLSYEGVTHVTTQIGGGSPRFLLTYPPEQSYPHFGRILVDTDDFSVIEKLSKQIQTDLEKGPIDANFNVKLFVLGPATGGKIQLRISGPDKEELRKLAATAKKIIAKNPNVKGLRDEWGDKVKTLRPRVSDTAMRRLGIDRQGVADAMAYSGEGLVSGVFRDNDELLPIISRAPEEERTNLSSLDQLLVWSPLAQQMVPVGQVAPVFDIAFENPHIWRQDRVAMLRLHFDQRTGLSSDLLADIKADIEIALNVDVAQRLGVPEDTEIEHNSSTIPLKYRDRLYLKDKPGYYMAWGGENEDSDKGSTAIAKSVPLFFGLMVFIIIALFNSLKKTLVIWLVVPLALVGVTAGLLVFEQPFGFMAMLGFMSLAGMLIKNAIVLVDQIGVELDSGKEPFKAIVDSGLSRMIPVSMAALTTILGMIPLLGDAFFVPMAVTIMFGLGFATVLTLVVVPVLYATLFGFHRSS
mgnify:FL=1